MKTKFISPFFLFLLLNCEPISVSVNSKGEIAFTRETGIFYYNLKSKSIQTVYWNYPNRTIPIISRWSPDSQGIAFTIRENENSNSTHIYIIDRDGKNIKKLLSSEKNIAQLEWSPDGNYLSYAVPGEDSDIGGADIGIISVKDSFSKIVLSNTSDVHCWYNFNIIYISIKEKNPNNSDIFKGVISMYDIIKSEYIELANAIVNKKGYIDCSKENGDIVVTAYKVDRTDTTLNYSEDNLTYSFLFNIKNRSIITKISQESSCFNLFSIENDKILMIGDDNSNFNLYLYDVNDKNIKNILNNISFKTNVSGSDIYLYPCWYDNNTILFFKFMNIYGANGQMLSLMSIDTDGKNLNNLQPTIESWMDNEIKKRGGYIINK